MLYAGRGKVEPQTRSDSDSNDEGNDSTDDDDVGGVDDDDDTEEEVKKREGSDYDSDKDPAWRPAGRKRTRVSHVAH